MWHVENWDFLRRVMLPKFHILDHQSFHLFYIPFSVQEENLCWGNTLRACKAQIINFASNEQLYNQNTVSVCVCMYIWLCILYVEKVGFNTKAFCFETQLIALDLLQLMFRKSQHQLHFWACSWSNLHEQFNWNVFGRNKWNNICNRGVFDHLQS